MAETFWMIEEEVGHGHYITLPGIFTTKEAADREIEHYPSNEEMRSVLYRQGTWRGPERA